MVSILSDDEDTCSRSRTDSQRHVSVVAWGADTSAGHVRPENQDSWAQASGERFAIADGMGGVAGGATASRLAVEGLMGADQEIGWVTVLRELNETVRRQCDRWGFPAAGTTLTGVAVEPGRVFTLHVGDSRLYRLRGGRLALLTQDHNLRLLRIEEGKDPDGPDPRGPQRAITSYLGNAGRSQRIDVGTISVHPDDRLLLCSDGVHGAVPATSLSAMLSAGSCEEAAQALVSAANANGGRDNATAVVIDLDST